MRSRSLFWGGGAVEGSCTGRSGPSPSGCCGPATTRVLTSIRFQALTVATVMTSPASADRS
jgi:hypothetical protein